MEVKKTQNVTQNVAQDGDPAEYDGYVSPDVLAAMAGEQVEFGMHVPTQEELDNNAD